MPNSLTKEKELELTTKTLEDVSAFTELYEAYVDKIYNYCFYKLYNEELANDMTGDIFLKALEAFQQGKYTFNEQVGFGGWLYRIAHNRIVDHYKKASTRKEIQLDEKINPKSDFEVEKLDIELDNNAEIQRIYEIIALLDDQTQSIFVLKFTEEYTFARIGEILSENESTVKMRYYRALKFIKKNLNLNSD